eukprot:ANDGO_03631.mRNA.1 Protein DETOXIFICATION 33
MQSAWYSREKLGREFRSWMSVAWSTVLGNLVESLPFTLQLFFLGFRSTIEVASVSLAQVWGYGFAISAWYGVAISQSSLVAPAAGRGDLLMVNTWTMIAGISNVLLMIPVSILWIFAADMFEAFGVNDVDLSIVREFLRLLLPSLFLSAVSTNLTHRVSAMHISGPVFYMDLFVCCTHIALSFPLIQMWGYKGAALTTNLCAGLDLFCAAVVTYKHQELPEVHQDPVSPTAEDSSRSQSFADVEFVVNSDSERGSRIPILGDVDKSHQPQQQQQQQQQQQPERLHLLVKDGKEAQTMLEAMFLRQLWKIFWIQCSANLVTILLEVAQSMVLSILVAIKIGSSSMIAACNLVAEIFELFAMVVYGFSEATAIRVGHHLGSNNVRGGKRSVAIATLTGFSYSLLVCSVFVATHPWIGRVFSSDEDVVADAAPLAVWSGGVFVAYGMYVAVSAVLDGQGRASINPFITIAGSWGITVLLAFLSLTYTDFGVQGMLAARLIGVSVSLVLCAIAVVRSDWEMLCTQASSW